MTVVTIALPKGRLADDTIAILERCGVDCSEINAKSRKLIFMTEPTTTASSSSSQPMCPPMWSRVWRTWGLRARIP